MTTRPAEASPADDVRFMRHALALGARQLGRAWPNPAVGSVVVAYEEAGPRVVSVGVTQAGGRPHAERVALDAAGAAARGATLYVTLEPCSHHGRTPPCADAIVAAGIARVVSGVPDPDPRVSGRGHEILRRAGVVVSVGVCAQEARRDHRGHIARVTLGRPSVTVKLARTADGYAAAPGPGRLLITRDIANGRTHLMRAHADAILVGVGTVLADDPSLTVRLPGLEARSPVRVVLDSGLRISPAATLVRTARSVPTWVVTTETVSPAGAAALEAAGCELIRVGADGAGRVDLAAALRALATRGITRVFCEGGPSLADALARADLIDEAVLITGAERLEAPGVPALGPAFATLIGSEMRLVGREPAGPDTIESYERVE